MNCPKCGYRRKASDRAPDWQCPSCGVAYAKVVNAPNPPTRYAAAPAAPKPSPGFGKLAMSAVGILVAGVALALTYPQMIWRSGGSSAEPAALGEIDWQKSHIVMYSLTTCGFCVEKRQEMQAKGIPFTEYFLDTDAARNAEFGAKLQAAGVPGGAIGTPSFEVNGKLMLNNPPLDAILRQAAL